MKNLHLACGLLLGLLFQPTVSAQTARFACAKIEGDTATFTARITYETRPAALGWKVTLPEGWSYVSGQTEPEVKPEPGQTKELEWACINVPATAVSFTFIVRNTGGTVGPHAFKAAVLYHEAEKAHTLELDPVRID